MKCTPAFLVTLGIALSLSGAPAFAQSTAWVTNGPSGGSVNALAVDPGQPAIVYAGTGNGLFRSDDSGVASERASEPRERSGDPGAPRVSA